MHDVHVLSFHDFNFHCASVRRTSVLYRILFSMIVGEHHEICSVNTTLGNFGWGSSA